jgi:predicted nucleic acid-binding protein
VIVADANVIAYFWLPGEFTHQAEAALERDADWIVPYLWRSEFRNILATYVRAKRLAAGDAQTIYMNAEDMLRGREYAVTGHVALDLAFNSSMSAYDCEYVALADEFNCKLVSSDRRLVKAFSQRAVLLAEFGKSSR